MDNALSRRVGRRVRAMPPGRRLGASVLAALSLLSGCGSDSNATDASNETSSSAPPSSEAIVEAEADESSGAGTEPPTEQTATSPPADVEPVGELPTEWPADLPAPTAADVSGRSIDGSLVYEQATPVNDQVTYAFSRADGISAEDALRGVAAWTSAEFTPRADSANPCNADAFAAALAAPIEELNSIVCAGDRPDGQYAVIVSGYNSDGSPGFTLGVRF